MNYPKGIRENGGQYTHSVSWYIMALIKAGYYDKAYKYYQMINPINRSLSSDSVNSYRVEPYVIAADIYSSEKFPGRGGWTWYTGSAGWFYRVGITEILGLKKQGNMLKIQPALSGSWKKYQIKYRYIDTIYEIEIVKDDKELITVDGKIKKNNEISLVNDGKNHKVVVYVR